MFNYTHSVGVSMLWWGLGAIVGMAGIVVFMELGLTLPLYRFDGVEISVPRSGGELNYVSSSMELFLISANTRPAQIYLRTTTVLYHVCLRDHIYPSW